MIKSTELIIGNMVEYNHKTIIVESITETGINLDVVSGSGFSGITFNNETISFKLINPIPLTEDWLLKFGFENNILHRIKILKAVDLYIVYFCSYTSNEGLDTKYYILKPYGIKFVHQLQNLFFALTEEELTIKEIA